uniref:C2H2-type domain-containing protein n=1 Tax=Trichogramma kaykai TaxID=54128 RepID=A0ABD2W3D1_9HYME
MNDIESVNAHLNKVKHKSCVIVNKQLSISEMKPFMNKQLPFYEMKSCETQCDEKTKIKETKLNGVKNEESFAVTNKPLPFYEMKSCETQCDEKMKNRETKLSRVKNEKSETFEPISRKRKPEEDNCTKIAKNNRTEQCSSNPLANKQSKTDELDFINDIVGLQLNKDKMKRFIPVHKRESQSKSCNVLADKVSKFDQNILKNGTQYIDLCIKWDKTNIYNTSSIKLANINLSINFITKVNDDHFCLLCKKQFSSEVYIIMEHFFSKEHIENLQKQNNSLTKTEDSSNISNDNLKFALPYISKTTNAFFYCHACKNDIAEYKIFEHALSQNHMLECEKLKKNAFNIFLKIMTLLKNTWYYAQFFDCQVCDMKYQMEIEFVEHLKNNNHCKKVKMCIEKGEVLEFHTCFACVTCIYGDSRKYYGHCDDIFHKRYLSKGDNDISKMMPPLIGLLSRIEDKRQKLLFESDSITLESSQENSLLKAVEKVVQHLYPNAKAYKFGSRCSYTALSNSDLDIFLDCDNMYHKNFDTALSRRYISSVIDCFKNLEDEWYIEETLFDTRVPIIKLRHYPTDLKCDISFSNGLACRKSKLVRYYNDAYKMCRELILYLKKWVLFSQLSGTEGWECGYQKKFCVTPDDSSFVENLVGLFTFYAEFDYQKYVICPYLGSIIEKEKFATEDLPAELTAILNDKNKKAVSLFRFDSPMCMQDPTDLSQNSTKALRKRQLRCFKEYCSSSVERIISGQQSTCS